MINIVVSENPSTVQSVKDFFRYVCKTIGGHDINLLIAHTPAEARALLPRARIAIIDIDFASGYKLAVESVEEFHIPVIVTSTCADTLPFAAEEHHLKELLRKPEFNYQQLRKHLEHLIAMTRDEMALTE